MTAPRVPRATYRLQFRAGFTFADAAAIVDYLDRLGVSHIYASPYLRARAGSAHGYDIVDHNALNPEIGDAEDYDILCRALAKRGMGQIVDFVPNHMGVGRDDNVWWLDVLEWGMESPYADYFDIDWNPAKPELRGKVLLPFLGDHYGRVLGDGQLRLAFNHDDGSFSVWYYEHRFPITPGQYATILAGALKALSSDAGVDEQDIAELGTIVAGFADLKKQAKSKRHRTIRRAMANRLKGQLAALCRRSPRACEQVEATVRPFNGVANDLRSFERLHRLLEAQPYRLAYWLVAAEEINYRRFFQINELAGIRIEVNAVFDAVHRLVLDLIGQGRVHGLRIDHIDGLFDPRHYLERLQTRAREARRSAGTDEPEQPFYIVVEKILAPHESLRDEWPIAGTTGYEVLNSLNGLFLDSSGEAPLTRIYERFLGAQPNFREIAYEARKQAMDQELASELRVLANEFNHLTERNWLTRDYTLVGIRQALREVVASFPVYRTYVDRRETTASDRRDIDWAIAHARRRSTRADTSVFDFIDGLITLDLGRGRSPSFNPREVARLAMKFQQYTGPVMAKGIEDTAFYRYNRLLSLNEVGGEPNHFGTTVSAFHHACQDAVRRWPHRMLTTATHDMKRGEDVRARLNVLSEVTLEWARRVRRWATLNRHRRTEVNDAPAPSANDEYLFYQTLLGTWPADLVGAETVDDDRLDEYRARIVDYMLKAVREAKVHSSWINQNTDYEQALTHFVDKVLNVRQSNPFVDDFRSFADRIAHVGVVNSLAQAALKLTIPGVPDTYQGCELWDLSLVDPDNRRPVDFAKRRDMLAALERSCAAGASGPPLRDLLNGWPDGRVKLFLTWRLLQLRRQSPELFLDASYEAVETEGTFAAHVIAFQRLTGGQRLLAVVPRLVARLVAPPTGWPVGSIWRDTHVILPDGAAGVRWHDVIADRPVEATTGTDGLPRLAVAALFKDFPIAVLTAAAVR